MSFLLLYHHYHYHHSYHQQRRMPFHPFKMDRSIYVFFAPAFSNADVNSTLAGPIVSNTHALTWTWDRFDHLYLVSIRREREREREREVLFYLFTVWTLWTLFTNSIIWCYNLCVVTSTTHTHRHTVVAKTREVRIRLLLLLLELVTVCRLGVQLMRFTTVTE